MTATSAGTRVASLGCIVQGCWVGPRRIISPPVRLIVLTQKLSRFVLQTREINVRSPRSEPYTLHPAPTPYALHQTPYTTRHPAPYTLHPTPYTLDPGPKRACGRAFAFHEEDDLPDVEPERDEVVQQGPWIALLPTKGIYSS